MWNDVVDLRDFYEGGLGQMARRMIRRQIRALWPDVRGERVLGLGFATPYLRPFRDDTERVLAVMPSSMGVLSWPPEGPGLVALADETDLPLPDRSIDRVVIIHTLESTEHVRGMMREVWRVLSDSGRLLVIVPNRRGIWARLDGTPFGQGRPYTHGQLLRMLRDNLFMPQQEASALYMPPVQSRFILRTAPAWEKLGEKLFHRFAGVVLVEASKQIYAGTALHSGAERHKPYIALPQGFRRNLPDGKRLSSR